MRVRVDLILSDDVLVADLPEWASYTIVEWHNDGTVTVLLDERTEMRMLLEQMQGKLSQL